MSNQSFRRFTAVIATVGTALALAPAAFAGTASQNITVQSSVTNNCQLDFTGGGTTLDFGAYDPVVTNKTTPLDTTLTFTLACTTGSSPTLTVSDGANFANSTRKMKNGTVMMNYGLFQDSGYATAWDSATPVSITANGTPVNVNLYGRVPAGQATVTAGSYSDTVTVTLNY